MQLRRSLIATGAVAVLAVSGVTAAVANDPPPRIAFLANGIVPADALAAGPIAGQLGAPIYTTAPGSLIESTGTALDAYDPDLVIVMGGPAAISDDVLAQVADVTGLSVEAASPPPTSGIVRAAGQDRFETAAAAAALLGSYDPAFLPTDMKAADSDKLDGKDSTDFLPADGKAETAGHADTADDADTLDGMQASDFGSAANTPDAIGAVNSSGSLVSTTPNVTSATYDDAQNRWEVAFEDISFYVGSDVAIAVPSGNTRSLRISSLGGELLVYTYDENGDPAERPFHFVVYDNVG